MNRKLTAEERAEVARRNGTKSKGPVTPEGKARSSKNAITHGLYARNVVVSTEDAEAYARHRQIFFDHFQPVGDYECELVTSIAAKRWRMGRMEAMETSFMEYSVERQRDAIDQEFDFVDDTIRLTLAFAGYDGTVRNGIIHVGRVEGRLHRLVMRDTAELRAAQKLRRAAEAAGTPAPVPTSPTAGGPGGSTTGTAEAPPVTPASSGDTDLRPAASGNPEQKPEQTPRARLRQAPTTTAISGTEPATAPPESNPPQKVEKRTQHAPGTRTRRTPSNPLTNNHRRRNRPLNPVRPGAHPKLAARPVHPLVNWL